MADDKVLIEYAKWRIRARYPHAFVYPGFRGVSKDKVRCFGFRLHPFADSPIGRPADTEDDAWIQAFGVLCARGQLADTDTEG